MDLVKALKNNSFDKNKMADTEAMTPEEWLNNFKDLLGKKHDSSSVEKDMKTFIENNLDNIVSDIDYQFTKKELAEAIKKLINNKANGFDCISN